jgi:AraC-like DNA-binding protein
VHWAGEIIPELDKDSRKLLGIKKRGVSEAVQLFRPEEVQAWPGGREAHPGPCLLIVASGDFLFFFETLRNSFGPGLRMENAGLAHKIFQTIFTGFRQAHRTDVSQEAELLYRLLFELRREQQTKPRLDDSIDFALQYLKENLQWPINSKTIAAKCGISPEHLIRAFTSRHGESPATMLRRLRTDQARELILSTRLDDKQIAAACGFTSVKSFTRAYWRRFGTSTRDVPVRHSFLSTPQTLGT